MGKEIFSKWSPSSYPTPWYAFRGYFLEFSKSLVEAFCPFQRQYFSCISGDTES